MTLSSRRRTPVFTPIPSSNFTSALRRSTRKLLWYATAMPFATISPPLRVVPVRGDGRCLYRAIAKNLASTDGRRLSENLERADADALRDIAWREICVERKKEFRAKQVIEGNLSSYCANMRNPRFYAGEAEMLALSDALRRPIMVYLRTAQGQLRNIITYGDQYTKGRFSARKTIRVLYMNGNHYDALLPR
ncbi:unnamed protein product [Agarophyton chilense]